MTYFDIPNTSKEVLGQGSQTQMSSRAAYGQFKSLRGRISAISRVGGPQKSTKKSCVYFKLHNFIMFIAFFKVNLNKLTKKFENPIFDPIFIHFLFLKTVGGPRV